MAAFASGGSEFLIIGVILAIVTVATARSRKSRVAPLVTGSFVGLVSLQSILYYNRLAAVSTADMTPPALQYAFVFWSLALVGIGAARMFGTPASSADDSVEVRQCPYCAETVKSAAVVCKHCGRELDVIATEPRRSGASDPQQATDAPVRESVRDQPAIPDKLRGLYSAWAQHASGYFAESEPEAWGEFLKYARAFGRACDRRGVAGPVVSAVLSEAFPLALERSDFVQLLNDAESDSLS